MLHASETVDKAVKTETVNHLRHNNRTMIHWICNIEARDVSSNSLLKMLGIQDMDVVLRTNRLRWFGHIERSTGWISLVRKLEVPSEKRPERQKKTWEEVGPSKAGHGFHRLPEPLCVERTITASQTGPTHGRGIIPALIK